MARIAKGPFDLEKYLIKRIIQYLSGLAKTELEIHVEIHSSTNIWNNIIKYLYLYLNKYLITLK